MAHAFTHFDLQIHPLRLPGCESAAVMESQESLWYNPRHPGDAARVGLPAPVKALLDGLALEHFQDMLE
jgi:adenine-specific DNA glycosylase